MFLLATLNTASSSPYGWPTWGYRYYGYGNYGSGSGYGYYGRKKRSISENVTEEEPFKPYPVPIYPNFPPLSENVTEEDFFPVPIYPNFPPPPIFEQFLSNLQNLYRSLHFFLFPELNVNNEILEK